VRVSPLIFTLGTKWTLVVFLLRPLHLREELQYPLNRRFGGTQSTSVCFGEKKIMFLPGFEPRTLRPIALSLYRAQPSKNPIFTSNRDNFCSFVEKKCVYRRRAGSLSLERSDFLKGKYKIYHG